MGVIAEGPRMRSCRPSCDKEHGAARGAAPGAAVKSPGAEAVEGVHVLGSPLKRHNETLFQFESKRGGL